MEERERGERERGERGERYTGRWENTIYQPLDIPVVEVVIALDEGPEEFLELIPKYMAVRKSATNEDLYILTDKKVAALDQSLSELNLIDR